MKSWKSTLLGLSAAALNLYANGASPKQVAYSVAIAALGALAKDYDVTGGASGNP